MKCHMVRISEKIVAFAVGGVKFVDGRIATVSILLQLFLIIGILPFLHYCKVNLIIGQVPKIGLSIVWRPQTLPRPASEARLSKILYSFFRRSDITRSLFNQLF